MEIEISLSIISELFKAGFTKDYSTLMFLFETISKYANVCNETQNKPLTQKTQFAKDDYEYCKEEIDMFYNGILELLSSIPELKDINPSSYTPNEKSPFKRTFQVYKGGKG